MKIYTNGEPMDILSGTTVAGLVALLDLAPEQVAVESDRVVVPRASWANTPISAGAAIEIIRFVGGG